MRDLFRERGHDAWSNDLDPCEGDPAYHIQGDAIEVAYGQQWDIMIAMPPCTYLANSGVRWLYPDTGAPLLDAIAKQERWDKMREGASFYTKLALAPIKHKVLENPVMHSHARRLIPLRWDLQYIQPWQFGHGEIKRTGLERWNLPFLSPTNVVSGRVATVHKMPPSDTRGKDRSRTYPGIARAMVEQYLEYLK